MLARRWMALSAVVIVVGVSACADDSSTADLEPSAPTSTTDLEQSAPASTASSGNDSDAVFSFTDDDLCEWVTEDEVAEFVAAEFDWEGMAAEVEADPTVACQWELSSADGTSGSVRVHDGGLSKGFGGNRFDYDAVMKSRGVLDYQGPVCVGEFVVDHPALSDGVVVHNGAIGQFAFGVPPDTEWLLLCLDVPGRTSDDWTSCDDGTTGGVASEDYEARFFAVVDQFLEELGWLSEQ